jgi:hypothetical protein
MKQDIFSMAGLLGNGYAFTLRLEKREWIWIAQQDISTIFSNLTFIERRKKWSGHSSNQERKRCFIARLESMKICWPRSPFIGTAIGIQVKITG